MPKVRKEIPELEKLVQVGRKKVVRYEEGAQLYSMNNMAMFIGLMCNEDGEVFFRQAVTFMRDTLGSQGV